LPAEELVVVGRVGKPHGVGGAFVVEGASDDPDRFAVGAELLVAGEQAHIEESKRSGGRLVIRLDRRAERGSPLEVPRSSLPPTGEDEYYVADLIGLEVVEEEGRTLGSVRDVSNYAANDVLELDSGLLLPLVEDCVRQVDLDAGRIVVSRGFADGQ
jgi:16S rRNA processing protein RimM